jgi:hypothetical protein
VFVSATVICHGLVSMLKNSGTLQGWFFFPAFFCPALYKVVLLNNVRMCFGFVVVVFLELCNCVIFVFVGKSCQQINYLIYFVEFYICEE